MALTLTPNLQLPYYADGDAIDWGNYLQALTTEIEGTMDGQASIACTGGTLILGSAGLTLISSTAPSINQQQAAVKIFTGTLTSAQTIVIANTMQTHIFYNNTSGAFSLSVKTSGGLSFTVTQGTAQMVYCDGNSNINALTPAVVVQTGALSVTSLAAAGTTGTIQYNNGGVFGGASLAKYSSSGNIVTVSASATTDVPLVAKGVSSQTGDLFEVQSSTGSVLGKFDSSGNLTTTGTLSVTGISTLTGAVTSSASTTTPIVAGGTGAASTLTIESTSGAGTTDAIIFKTGSQTEAVRINTSQQLVATNLGSVGTPLFAPSGGLTSGIYFPSTSSIGFSIANSQIALVNSSALIAATMAGGTAVGSTLTIESTTAAGSTDAIIFKTATQTEAARFNNTQQFVTIAGGTGTPSIAGTGGLTTGIYWPSTSSFGVTVSSANMLTINSTGVGIKATTPSNAFLQFPQGTTAIAPIVFNGGGSLLTSAVAGGVEFDAVQLYNTIDTSSGRGAIPVEQYFHLTANGGNVSTIGNFFGTTSNFALVASAYYMIDYEVWYTVTGGTPTVTWTFTNSAAPTSQNIVFRMSPVAGMVAPPGTATMLEGQIQNDTTTAKTIVTGTLAAATYYTFIRIYLQNGTGTSLKFQATASTNSITPLLGSWCRCRRLSPNNIGTFAA